MELVVREEMAELAVRDETAGTTTSSLFLHKVLLRKVLHKMLLKELLLLKILSLKALLPLLKVVLPAGWLQLAWLATVRQMLNARPALLDKLLKRLRLDRLLDKLQVFLSASMLTFQHNVA